VLAAAIYARIDCSVSINLVLWACRIAGLGYNTRVVSGWPGMERIFMKCLYVSLAIALASASFGQTIRTVAGGGPANGASATSMACDGASVTVSPTGLSYYISCRTLYRVFRVDGDGAITLIAGNGSLGFSGDDGPATDAQLDFPQGLAIDPTGNVFIADTRNNRIRKVTPAGIITTVAGSGYFQGFGGDGGPAVSALLSQPNSVAVDSTGNLYIADTYNNRVRRVAPSGIITTVAGNGTNAIPSDGVEAIRTSVNFPNSVAIDATGALLIADTFNHRIRKVSPQGIITTVAGNGTRGSATDSVAATGAPLNFPYGVAQAAGSIYIADTTNQRIRRVSPDGLVNAIAGTGVKGYSGDDALAVNSQVSDPLAVAVDSSGDVYIADTGNLRIRRIRSGVMTTVAGNGYESFSGDDGPAIGAQLGGALDVAVDAEGNIYVADTFNHRVRKVAPDGVITTVAGNGRQGFAGDDGPATSGELSEPFAVTVDNSNHVLYIADTGNNRIRKVSADGVISTVAGGGDSTEAPKLQPYGLAVDSSGNLYIADHNNHCIRKLTSEGTTTIVAGSGREGYSGDGGAAVLAELASPYGVALDPADNLFIADTGNYRIRRVSADGVITTIAGNGGERSSGDGGPATDAQFEPRDVAVDAQGNLYVSDATAHRIRKVTPDGTISTLAGNDMANFSGDGGLAQNAEVNSPAGIAVDSQGALFIADSGNWRIRVVTPQQ